MYVDETNTTLDLFVKRSEFFFAYDEEEKKGTALIILYEIFKE